MGERSAIAWTDATWNPVAGCTRVSAGCDNCYAAALAAGRLRHTPQYQHLAVVTPSGRAAFNGRIRLLPNRLEEPLHWRRPRRVFVNSMSDLFHEDIPDSFIAAVFAVMAAAYQHTFQVLTKRPARMQELLSREDFWTLATIAGVERWWGAAQLVGTDLGVSAPLSNVWLGVSVEDQAAADERIPLLVRTPAAVRFLSIEPLLGPVDLAQWIRPSTVATVGFSTVPSHPVGAALTIHYDLLQWVIVGGESGPAYRPMDFRWVAQIKAQCDAAGVPYFFKQRSSTSPGRTDGVPTDLLVQDYPRPVPV